VFTEVSDTKSARNWFKHKEGTFETVCEALNLDSDRVHKNNDSGKINQVLFQERLEKNIIKGLTYIIIGLYRI